MMTIVEQEPIAAISTSVPSGPILGIAQKTPALSFSSFPSDAAITQRTVHLVGFDAISFNAPFENSATEQQQTMAQCPCVFNDCAFTFFRETRVAIKIITGPAWKTKYVVGADCLNWAG